MPTPLTGMTGRYIITQPEAPPEVVHGGPVDPAHSIPGEQAQPYPWQITQWGADPLADTFGTDVALVGDSIDAFGAGSRSDTDDPQMDHTPYGTHAAPWPKDPVGDGSVGPDNTARQLIQSRAIHSARTNAAGRGQYNALDPVQDQWVEYSSTTPGTSLQPTGIPQAVGVSAGGFGSRDVVGSHAAQNDYGFRAAHLYRRVATGSIPGNFLWMQGGSRPLVRTLPAANRLPTGKNSPFAGQDTGTSFGTDGAILTDTPTDYTPPPQVNTAPLPPGTGAPQPGVGDWF